MKYSHLFIVCGHGMGANRKIDNGSVANGTTEYEECREVCQDLEAMMASKCPQVEVTVLGVDSRQTLLGKIRDVNGIMRRKNLTENDALLVSVHMNSASPAASGVETWFSEEEGTQQLADLCSDKVSALTGLPDRGSKEAKTNRWGRLGILNDTKAKGVLVECGFLTSQFDVQVIKDKDLDNMFAQGILDALLQFTGWDFVTAPDPDDRVRRAIEKNSEAWKSLAESKRLTEQAQDLLHEANEILRGNM